MSAVSGSIDPALDWAEPPAGGDGLVNVSDLPAVINDWVAGGSADIGRPAVISSSTWLTCSQ